MASNKSYISDSSIYPIFRMFLLLIFCQISDTVTGQSKMHGGSGAGSPSAAPNSSTTASSTQSTGSGSTQLIQGFHYVLKKHFHIHYKSITITTEDFGKFMLLKDVDTIALHQQTVSLNRTLRPSTISSKDTLDYDRVAADSLLCFTKPCFPPTIKQTDSVYVTDSIRIITQTDTVDRYWVKHEYNSSDQDTGYKPKKARVSINQLDSGKLQVIIKRSIRPEKANRNEEGIIVVADKAKYNYDTTTWHFATPVMATDSANNFYLQIVNKAFVTNPIYFLRLPYRIVQYGIVTIPYKIRFSNNRKFGGYTASAGPNPNGADTISTPSESTTGFNLSLYLGYKMGNTRFYYDQTKTHNNVAKMFAVFAGPELITLTAGNTLFNTNLTKNPSSIVAISTGISTSFEWQAFSFGLFSGVDFPLQSNSPWVYKDKIWIGFGIGFNLGMYTSATSQSN